MSLTPAQVAPYFRMGERHLLMQSVVYGLAGKEASELGQELHPHLPISTPLEARTIGHYCRGDAIQDCLQVFGCDEPTLERIACRTCPR